MAEEKDEIAEIGKYSAIKSFRPSPGRVSVGRSNRQVKLYRCPGRWIRKYFMFIDLPVIVIKPFKVLEMLYYCQGFSLYLYFSDSDMLI